MVRAAKVAASRLSGCGGGGGDGHSFVVAISAVFVVVVGAISASRQSIFSRRPTKLRDDCKCSGLKQADQKRPTIIAADTFWPREKRKRKGERRRRRPTTMRRTARLLAPPIVCSLVAAAAAAGAVVGR